MPSAHVADGSYYYDRRDGHAVGKFYALGLYLNCRSSAGLCQSLGFLLLPMQALALGIGHSDTVLGRSATRTVQE